MRDLIDRLSDALAIGPPGWIPAWVITGLYLRIIWRAADIDALRAAELLGQVLMGTLATWLAYRVGRAWLNGRTDAGQEAGGNGA